MLIETPEKLNDLAKICPFPLYAVGGTVRDALAGLPCTRDWDLAAPVPAEKVAEFALRCGMKETAVYKNTGTVNFSDGENHYEFTSFRSDFYRGGEHAPAKITFTDNILADAKRRDFRCNAVYYDIAKGELIDPLNGIEDISARIFATTRAAEEVFSEDGLRLMRLARQAGAMGFCPTEECMAGARQNADKIQKISAERIYSELVSILHADQKYGIADAHYKGLKILDETRVLDQILPELSAGRGMAQRSDFHNYDVLEHTLRACLYADRKVRLAALLHDIGKPYCFLQNGKYHGHDVEGAKIGREILTRLKAPKKETETIVRLIATHMYDLDGKTRENKIRSFIIENYDIYPLILLIKQADYTACKDDKNICPAVKKFEEIREKMVKEGVPFTLKELKISGNHLKGLTDPKNTGKILAELFKKCTFDGRENVREKLIRQAQKMIEKENEK